MSDDLLIYWQFVSLNFTGFVCNLFTLCLTFLVCLCVTFSSCTFIVFATELLCFIRRDFSLVWMTCVKIVLLNAHTKNTENRKVEKIVSSNGGGGQSRSVKSEDVCVSCTNRFRTGANLNELSWVKVIVFTGFLFFRVKWQDTL